MSDLSREDLEDLADIYQALANEKRLRILLQLYQDEPVSELTDELGISRSGLQKNIERLLDSELAYRPQKEGSKTYALSPLGEHYVHVLEKDSETSIKVREMLEKELARLEEEQSDTRETLEEAGVDVTEFDRKLKEEAWQNIWEDAEDKL
jgi:DNA-binding transcriptional ArsR family regulator